MNLPVLTFAGVAIDAVGTGAAVATRIRGAFVVVDLAIVAPRAERTFALVFADPIEAVALILTRFFGAFVDVLIRDDVKNVNIIYGNTYTKKKISWTPIYVINIQLTIEPYHFTKGASVSFVAGAGPGVNAVDAGAVYTDDGLTGPIVDIFLAIESREPPAARAHVPILREGREEKK